MRDEANKDLGFVLVFEDLTELIKAQKVAAWQEVAKRVAHEIKNPLTPIQLSAQRLRKKFFEKSPDLDRVFDDATNVIINEVGSLKQMLDEFSKFARLPAPQMTRQSLHDVLRDVVTLYREAQKDIQFVIELDDTLPPINFDREQLRRVFVNLFDNAVQAMNQRGDCGSARDTTPSADVRWLLLRTKAQASRRKIMTSCLYLFYSQKTGTGLGLAIVRRIITDHEGQIQVGNNQPRGAVFKFDLPV